MNSVRGNIQMDHDHDNNEAVKALAKQLLGKGYTVQGYCDVCKMVEPCLCDLPPLPKGMGWRDSPLGERGALPYTPPHVSRIPPTLVPEAPIVLPPEPVTWVKGYEATGLMLLLVAAASIFALIVWMAWMVHPF